MSARQTSRVDKDKDDPSVESSNLDSKPLPVVHQHPKEENVDNVALSSSPNPQNSAEALESGISWKTTTTNRSTTIDSSHASLATPEDQQHDELTLPADLSVLPLSPLPHHLAPYLSHKSDLSDADKRSLFTSVYLRASSAGSADTLEWLLAIPTTTISESTTSPNTQSSQTSDSTTEGPSLEDIRAQLVKRRQSTASSIFTISTTCRSSNANHDHDDDENDEGQLDSEQIGIELRKQRERERRQEERTWQQALPITCARKWIDIEARDDEGNSALGLCVALGHAEGVRVLVEAGVDIEGGDRAGWTPLHWAVQNNDIPIAAYLLNHGASPLRASHKGLTPRDLVKRGEQGAAMRDVLRSAFEAARERETQLRGGEGRDEDASAFSNNNDNNDTRSVSRSSFISSSTTAGWMSMPEKVEEEKRARDNRRRMELAIESARNLDVDLGLLGITTTTSPNVSTSPFGRNAVGFNLHDKPDQELRDDPDQPPPSSPFVWNSCEPDQMLVFSLQDLPVIFEVVITTMKPVRCQPQRSIPANVVFLCARFAHYFGSRELLEELIVGAMERIEAAVHHRPHDMTNCAFWLYNTLLLMYYLRKEPNLSLSTRDLQPHLRDLINEIFVFVIRDAERRIDKVLELALLEHEALPGFEDVRFEDEWSGTRFVKKLTGRSKKSNVNNNSMSAGQGNGGMTKSTSAMSIFSSMSGATTAGDQSFNNGFDQSTMGEPSPQNVTSLLSSTLFILQLYDIPPSIVVQAFSQLFYWIACEMFNRLLTHRKYLCRSRAMQIRLNASALEDWSRSNRFPTKMVSHHFGPLNQMLQWLQCLSSETTVDGLISTIQSLKSLNPLQLRKASEKYRYEVDESHLSQDCQDYLQQLQRQWERMRVHGNKVTSLDGNLAPPTPTVDIGINGSASPATSSAASSAGQREELERVTKMIDDVFKDPSSFALYTPPPASEPLGELLNSRYMLPFAVPSSADMLLNLTRQDAFGPWAHVEERHARSSTSGKTLHHSQSIASITSSIASTSSRQIVSRTPTTSSPTLLDTNVETNDFDSDEQGIGQFQIEWTPLLPDDFFNVLDRAKHQIQARLYQARLNNQSTKMDTGASPTSHQQQTQQSNPAGVIVDPLSLTNGLVRSTTANSLSSISTSQHEIDNNDEDDEFEREALVQIEQQRRRESEWRGLGFGAEVAAAEGFQGKWYDWRDGMPRGEEEDDDVEELEGESTEGDESINTTEADVGDKSVELFDAEASESGSDLESGDDEAEQEDQGEVQETPRPRDGFAKSLFA
ncbi:hypothetical protein OIO90_002692 [Microbotryomycetes sp. JL221]|nr:hypothetical protein OIO90_002692 [Microbotryomycetes sp. JL221]